MEEVVWGCLWCVKQSQVICGLCPPLAFVYKIVCVVLSGFYVCIHCTCSVDWFDLKHSIDR